MKIRPILYLVVVAQLVLLSVELLTHYDTDQRQVALAITNLVSLGAILGFDRWLRKKGGQLSVTSCLLVVAAVWLDALGNFQHLYAGFWWWDRLTHTIGGMALSAGFIDFFLSYQAAGKLKAGWTWTAWMGFLVGQLLGSMYEISEWLGDMWFHTERVRGPYDTPHDLFQNLVGGLLVVLLLRLFRKQH